MAKPTIFIDGEAGTTGLQLRSRLKGRDDIELVSIATEKRKDEKERARLLNEVDLAILCLPDDAARAAVALIRNPAVRVLDASSAHRVHPDWTYGYPELLPGQAERIRAALRVSNPGCYPTGAVALVRPLVDAGLLPADYPLAVHALQGYTGGGRQLIEAFEGTGGGHIDDPYRLYALELQHKHAEEIRVYSGLTYKPLFWPAYGAYPQGELVQIPLFLRGLPKRVTGADLHGALATRYAGERFLRVVPFESRPDTHLAPEALNGTNSVELFVFENRTEEQILLIARLDNLGKGASGAAVQNMDLMLGLENDQRTYSLDKAP